MKFILPVGLLVIAILTQSFADEHEHEHGHNHDDDENHPCAQPKYVLEPGKVACLAVLQHWYHNHSTGKCEPLEYDGCNKNANNFETQKQCEDTCNAWHEAHKDHDHGDSKKGECPHGHGHHHGDGHNHEHHHGDGHTHKHHHGDWHSHEHDSDESHSHEHHDGDGHNHEGDHH